MKQIASNTDLLTSCKRQMDQSGVVDHRFLKRFEAERLNRNGLVSFLIQWYKTATAHREAFPGLIANIKDDEIRFDLIAILYEEYGDGNRSRIHVKLLERLLHAVDLTRPDVEKVEALPAVSTFRTVMSETWSNGSHPTAYGLHFGLEYLACAQQQHCARGMAKYEFLSSADREYFDLHAKAEVRHVAASEYGFLRYAADARNYSGLIAGVEQATILLRTLWDEFDGLLFSASS